MSLALLVQGAEALDELFDAFGLSRLEKALDPSNPKDFLKIVDELSRALQGLTGAAEAAALAEALNILDVDWAKTSTEDMKRIRNAAQSVLSKPAIDYPKVAARFRVTGERVINGVKQQVNETYGTDIGVKLTEVDKRIVEKSAKAQGFYVKDQYAKRAASLDKMAADIITKGVETGAGRAEIAKNLQAAMSAANVARSESYWMMSAAAHVNRSRVYGCLSSYEEAGFDEYEFVAIRDQVTSAQCRFLHGKRFSVKRALSRYDAITDDPESVKTAMPWVSVGKNEEGEEILYFKDASGQRQTVANITENAVGQKDKSGSFDAKMTNEAMADAGIAQPPCHGHCRSRLKAVTDIALRRPAPRPASGGSPAPSAPSAGSSRTPTPAAPPAPVSAPANAPKQKRPATQGAEGLVLVRPGDPPEKGFAIPPEPKKRKPKRSE